MRSELNHFITASNSPIPDQAFEALASTLSILHMQSSGMGRHLNLAREIEYAADIDRATYDDNERSERLEAFVQSSLEKAALEDPERAAYLAIGLSSTSIRPDGTPALLFLTGMSLSGDKGQKIVDAAWRAASQTRDPKKHHWVSRAFEHYTEYLTTDKYLATPQARVIPVEPDTLGVREIVLLGSAEDESDQTMQIRETLGVLGLGSVIRYEQDTPTPPPIRAEQQTWAFFKELVDFAGAQGAATITARKAWDALAQSDLVTRQARRRVSSTGASRRTEDMSPQGKAHYTNLAQRVTIFDHIRVSSRRDADEALLPKAVPRINLVGLYHFLGDILLDADFRYREKNELGGDVTIGRTALNLAAHFTNEKLQINDNDILPTLG